MNAVAALLPDGRLHLQHGPIDCICRAWGELGEVRAAYGQAARFFAGVLDGLCVELPLLRSALPTQPPHGEIARAMHAACMPFADRFITPMAAVAGAVADGVLAAMVAGRCLLKAFVNNGGDIAFHLPPGAFLRCGLVTDLSTRAVAVPTSGTADAASHMADAIRFIANLSHDIGRSPHAVTRLGPAIRDLHGARWRKAGVAGSSLVMTQETDPARTSGDGDSVLAASLLDGTFILAADHPARGLATSGRACKGRGGRSFSFGIADSVTVLARTAAGADAAATIIGNAVDLPGHRAIDRRPASEIDPASDLGSRLITYEIGPLTDDEIEEALDVGQVMVDILLRDRLIEGAVLAMRGRLRVCRASLALQEPT